MRVEVDVHGDDGSITRTVRERESTTEPGRPPGIRRVGAEASKIREDRPLERWDDRVIDRGLEDGSGTNRVALAERSAEEET